MEREKTHRLLDAVLDIVEGGEGVGRYPYVSLEIKNYGSDCQVYIMDNGFMRDERYDGVYSLAGEYGTTEVPEAKYTACMEHLDRLRKEHMKEGDVADAG